MSSLFKYEPAHCSNMSLQHFIELQPALIGNPINKKACRRLMYLDSHKSFARGVHISVLPPSKSHVIENSACGLQSTFSVVVFLFGLAS